MRNQMFELGKECPKCAGPVVNRTVTWAFTGLLAAVSLTAISCDSLNPSFVEVIGGQPDGPVSRGHVAVVLANGTTFNQQLLEFMVAEGLDPSIMETPNIRPRIRVRVLITFTNGGVTTVELVEGTPGIIQGGFDPSAFVDITDGDLNNYIIQCDVARVDVISAEVFVPVEFRTFREDDTNLIVVGGVLQNQFVVDQTEQPQFLALRRDDLDGFGNILVRRNFDVREAPAPALDLLCGTVVGLELRGQLDVSFFTGLVEGAQQTVPGVDVEDLAARASHPGRFEFLTSVR